jgi:hypothetical protein
MGHPSSWLFENPHLRDEMWVSRYERQWSLVVGDRLKYLVWFICGGLGFPRRGGVSELAIDGWRMAIWFVASLIDELRLANAELRLRNDKVYFQGSF